MRKEDLKKIFYLLAGKIDDADETYLNGVKVGSTGVFPPSAVSAWNEQRVYRIQKNLLREDNVLAIRVFDMGMGGGISGGQLGIVDSTGFVRALNLSPGPKASFTRVVTSNGMLAAVISTERGIVEEIRPRIYQSYDSLRRVEPCVRGVRLKGYDRPARVGYLHNTHIVRVEYSDLTVSYFAPFTTGERVLYAVVEGKKQVVEKAGFVWEKDVAGLRTTEVPFPDRKEGARKYVLFSVRDSLAGESGDLRPSRARLLTSQGSLLEDEEGYMRFVFSKARLPDRLNSNERNLAQQSIAVIKMAQVSPFETGGHSRGQILASLPPGEWNIAWVRDGSYAILALSRLGLFEEAHNGLKFFLDAKVGNFKKYLHTDGRDYGVARDYRISVCRYYGAGEEESDFNQSGPNIELDGFGLFLTAYCDYMRRSRDSLLLQESYAVVADQVADVILDLIASNGLIRQDSGPWERHLPGKQYAYTSIACAKGLAEFGALSQEAGAAGWYRYAAGANRIQAGIERLLVVGGKYVRGNVQNRRPEELEYFDGATFEAFGFGLLKNKNLFEAHRKVYEKYLRIPGLRRGFRRVNGGDSYDRSEWLFLDMRIASALIMFGERKKALRLINWVTAQSRLNNNLIAELYGERTSAYEGAVPMVGFGAGAYLLALTDYYGEESTSSR
jgi:hypothetical protein